ncbi:MAG TPA: PQQ-dependent sugar dehydrogenase [Rhizomicrobium sp.]
MARNLKISVILLGLCSAGAALAADHPGQTFLVTADKMPKPYATAAGDFHSTVIPRPSGAALEVPKGFSVSVFADHLSNARWMALAPNGDVFLAEPGAGKITLLRDSKGAGHADLVTTFASGFDKPHGLAFHDGALYVADMKAVWRIPYKDGATTGGKPVQITKAADLRPKGNHVTRDIAFDSKGNIYLGFGSRDNISDFRPGAEVDKITPDGNMTPFATGIRNPVGVVFYPGTDNLYVTVNERDGLGNGLVPDYFTHVQPGGFYGYPYSYIGANRDPQSIYKDQHPELAARAIVPDVLFQSHSAPLGLVFYEGSQFPAAYKGDAFVALHGSWNANDPTGYKVVRIRFHNGKPEKGYENFLTGFWTGGKTQSGGAEVWGRPAGLAVAKDGSLLIADDAGNVVWRVAYTGK